MTIVYSPFLVVIALYESKFEARRISQNRLTGLADDDSSLGWDMEDTFHPEQSEWAGRVKSTIPQIEEDEIFLLKQLRGEVEAALGTIGDRIKDSSNRE